MIFKHTSSLMQIHTLGLYSIIDLPIPSSSFNNLFECSMFQVIIHSLYIHSTTIRNPCLLWCSKNTWKCQKIRQWCPRKHHLKFDQPKHAKSWKKLNSTCIMFILTCVVKHAFQHLVVVPCGSHVVATSAPSWTGSATCPRFSSGPLLMWQMTGSRQNELSPWWHLTWPRREHTWMMCQRWRVMPRHHTLKGFRV